MKHLINFANLKQVRISIIWNTSFPSCMVNVAVKPLYKVKTFSFIQKKKVISASPNHFEDYELIIKIEY